MNVKRSRKYNNRTLAVFARNDSRFMKIHQRMSNLDLLSDLAPFNTKKYDTQDYFKVFEEASLQNISITQACDMNRLQGERCPSMEQVMKCCRQNSTPEMIEFINVALKRDFNALPAKIRQQLKKSGIICMGFHQDPYYGDPDNPHVKKNRVKASTDLFHEYLTADAHSGNGSVTIAIIPRVPDQGIFEHVKRLITLVEKVLSPKKMVFDGEFAIIDVIALLHSKNIHFIGRKSRTPRVKAHLEKYYSEEDWETERKWRLLELRSKRSNAKQVNVEICPQKVQDEMKTMIKSPGWKITVKHAEKMLGKRFIIESGYRDKHKFQIFTNTKVLSTRLLFLLFAALSWNCWQALLIWVRSLKSYSKKVPRSFSITLTSTWVKSLLFKVLYT